MTDLANVRRLNKALKSCWRSGLVPEPRLESEALEKAALKGRPEDAFGTHFEWRVPLQILTQALAREADLNPLGRTMAHGQMVMALRARMKAAKLWREYPEILEMPVEPPIIILGQMRSGTTRLQRLLACDDRLAHTRLFESLVPVPRFGRRVQAGAILSLLRRLNPGLGRIHPSAVTAPEEEFGLFSFSFGSAQFEAQWRIPSFSRWWEKSPTSDLYLEFRRLLQTIAWSRKARKVRRWVLKAPQFLQDLPTVLETFPGATLLRLQRDPGEVVASSSSLVWNQMRIQSDHSDPVWVGQEWLRKTRLRDEIATRSLGAGTSAHIVQFEAMNRDWKSEMACIYQHLGLELTPEVEQRMERYVKGARSHRGHHYSLSQFGLSEGEVRSAFEHADEFAEMRPVVAPAA